MLYVSHSVAEILELTGQVIVLNRGRVVAHGDFFEVAHQPEVLTLVEAHGFENVLPVEVVATSEPGGYARVRYRQQDLKVPPCDHPPGSRIFIGIRANDIILSRGRPPEGLSIRNALRGHVEEVHAADGTQLVSIDVGGKRLMSEVTGEALAELGLKEGDAVTCLMKTHSFRIGPEVG